MMNFKLSTLRERPVDQEKDLGIGNFAGPFDHFLVALEGSYFNTSCIRWPRIIPPKEIFLVRILAEKSALNFEGPFDHFLVERLRSYFNTTCI